MPDPTAARYQGTAGEHYHRSKHEVPPAALPWVARARAKKFQDHVNPTHTVLEYGVGSGWNLASLKCNRRIGFDLSTFLKPDIEKLGIEFVASPEDIPTGSADVVICHHVLEHVLTPPAVLSEIRRVLKPTGRLLLVVPAERPCQNERFIPAEPNHHLYTWTIQTLGNLVTDCGFQVREATLHVYGYDRFAAVQALKLHLGETGFHLLRRTLQILRPLYEVRLIASPSA